MPRLDFSVVGRGNLHQVTHGGRKHVLITFKVLVVLGKAPEGTGDIGGATDGFSAMMRGFLTLNGSLRAASGNARIALQNK
ncbi:hypothetical protein ACTMU2_37870 [Cupriavidus basilensis]